MFQQTISDSTDCVRPVSKQHEFNKKSWMNLYVTTELNVNLEINALKYILNHGVGNSFYNFNHYQP